MAMAGGKSECVTCGKGKVAYKCEGCSQSFCFNHLADHRQQLSKQLDEVEDKHNLFRQSLTEQKTNPEKHSLIQQINQWEKDSIKKIRQTAEEARQLLIEHTNRYVDQIEVKLDQLTKQMKEIRHENDLNEIVLNQLKQKLTELEEGLIKPPNLSIREDSSSFINKIFVIISPQQLNIQQISMNTKWIQNGITVVGGNGSGNGLNQLSNPGGVCIDDDQTIYVADCDNHRIIEWKNGAASGQVVAGGNGKGNRNNQLDNPVDVIIDKQSDSLIIVDSGNQRLVRWSRRNGASGETIIPNVVCWGLAMDNNGYLYVSDYQKHEVRRWNIGETNGTLVAGGNGKGNRLDQLSDPFYIFVDKDHSVYVSDYSNHRVMKWMKGAKEGIVVAGGEGQGNGRAQLSNPHGAIVDQLGTVYVADNHNHRVMRWWKGAREGSIVVGGNGQGGQENQLNVPLVSAFDRQNNLFVVDNKNHRVQKFTIRF